MEYELKYADMTDMMLDRIRAGKTQSGKVLEGSWLDLFDENELAEAERLNVILPAIKWEIENDTLTEELKGELNWYYRALRDGKLDGILGDDEAEKVINDLLECYKKVFS